MICKIFVSRNHCLSIIHTRVIQTKQIQNIYHYLFIHNFECVVLCWNYNRIHRRESPDKVNEQIREKTENSQKKRESIELQINSQTLILRIWILNLKTGFSTLMPLPRIVLVLSSYIRLFRRYHMISWIAWTYNIFSISIFIGSYAVKTTHTHTLTIQMDKIW